MSSSYYVSIRPKNMITKDEDLRHSAYVKPWGRCRTGYIEVKHRNGTTDYVTCIPAHNQKSNTLPRVTQGPLYNCRSNLYHQNSNYNSCQNKLRDIHPTNKCFNVTSKSPVSLEHLQTAFKIPASLDGTGYRQHVYEGQRVYNYKPIPPEFSDLYDGALDEEVTLDSMRYDVLRKY